jgi:hypothetical protein
MKILETNKPVHLQLDSGYTDPELATSWFAYAYLSTLNVIGTGAPNESFDLRQTLSLSDVTVDRLTGVKTCYLIVSTVSMGIDARPGITEGMFGHLTIPHRVVARALFKLEL